MRRVAVFGNAGGGKSTLARRLAGITGLPLHVIDIIQYRDGRYDPDRTDGGKLSAVEFHTRHRAILGKETWIIDGFGGLETIWDRIAAADTLVHVDLPLIQHYWGVTRRFIGAVYGNPTGWPANSPILASTLDGYRVVGRCHRRLTPAYRARVAASAAVKRVHHLTSRRAIGAFLRAVAAEQAAHETALHPSGGGMT